MSFVPHSLQRCRNPHRSASYQSSLLLSSSHAARETHLGLNALVHLDLKVVQLPL